MKQSALKQDDVGFYYMFYCGGLDEIITDKLLHLKQLNETKEKHRILNKKSFNILWDNIEKHYGQEIDPNIIIDWFVSKFTLEKARHLIHYRILLNWKKSKI